VNKTDVSNKMQLKYCCWHKLG